MITLESPVATVLGAQAKPALVKKITEGLGLRTVGDLMMHFPRRYVRTGELVVPTDLPDRAGLEELFGRAAQPSIAASATSTM